jgi:hypothetical protein
LGSNGNESPYLGLLFGSVQWVSIRKFQTNKGFTLR